MHVLFICRGKNGKKPFHVSQCHDTEEKSQFPTTDSELKKWKNCE